jgi:Family of unknown function (DUF6095)
MLENLLKLIIMETPRTNKELLGQGLKKMAISLVMMFAGPTLFYIATTNKEKPLYIPLLILSLLICGGAIFFAYKGIQTIIESMFGKRN